MHYNSKSESFGNIRRAFENEAAGHVKYMILEDNARKTGNEDLARIYADLSREELSHARLWYNETHGSDEGRNLGDSITDEGEEAMRWYPEMAAKAEMEGYEGLADKFLANGMAEAGHRDRLSRYRDEVASDGRYRCHEEAMWRCLVCGYGEMGTTPPEKCPLCGYDRRAFGKDCL